MTDCHLETRPRAKTTLHDPPSYAAWQHREARDGFEVVFISRDGAGLRFGGHTTAVEGGEAWTVGYEISVDRGWLTRSARVTGRSRSGARELALRSVGSGRWVVDGEPTPHLDGCLDVDLESSVLTNAFPVHRLALAVGEGADAPAVYVRASQLRVDRLEQHYHRLPDLGGRERYRYTAPAFDFECELVYDEFGLLIDYPGIASRAA